MIPLRTYEQIQADQYQRAYCDAARQECRCENAWYWMRKFQNLCKENEEAAQRRANASGYGGPR
jgi:hypothetical protein